jgi:hypothetical protein
MGEEQRYEVRYAHQMGDLSWVQVIFGPTTEADTREYYEQWIDRTDARNVTQFGPDGPLPA